MASGGGPVYQYVWSARSAEAPILRETIVGGTPDVTQRLYYLDDANYNVTALVSYTGTVLERYQCDAYGNVTVCDAGWNPLASNASQYSSAILFAGCQLDADTGLYLMGARWYDPGLSRFISRDPTGYAGSPTNLYTYCGDNPVGAIDPSGTTQINPNTPLGPQLPGVVPDWLVPPVQSPPIFPEPETPISVREGLTWIVDASCCFYFVPPPDDNAIDINGILRGGFGINPDAPPPIPDDPLAPENWFK